MAEDVIMKGPGAVDDEDEEKLCRYCFDGEEDGELISPCKCAGGQKWVHLKCLRQWQRMVLVTQPTHPAFYEKDLRHQTCNVCKAEFTCPPPTRHELMASFTGPEIAALIDAGCVIAAHEAFSAELERQLGPMPPFMRERSSYEHWIRGVYLITAVDEDDGQLVVPVDSQHMLQGIHDRMGEEMVLSMQGRRFTLAASHSLEGVARGDLRDALLNLSIPCTVCLSAEEPINCGSDHVVAVNLTRPMEVPPNPEQVERAVAAVCAKYKGASQVQITHFKGGPCDDEDLMCCIVLGGGGRGWTVLKDLKSPVELLKNAVELAHSRAVKRFDVQGTITGGQSVRLVGLQAAPELNGEVGIALRFAENSSRWLVRLRNGEGKQLRPQNLEPLSHEGGRVFAVWGDARWSRAQLLGEIAKGDWGLCRANVGDLTASPNERWDNTKGRLAFAPITEMTEGYMREAQREMQATRAVMQMQSNPAENVEPADE